MKSLEDIEADIVSVINDKQQVTLDELRSFATSSNLDEAMLKRGLGELESANIIASRSSGGILIYYILQDTPFVRRIMIVEDDKNINTLMSLTVGKGYDITQIYNGLEALEKIRYEKPDLVILDLMLPGMDGLSICQTIKKDPGLKDTIVIIVSAMDATSNRFRGIKYGADYYIKKPFEPSELRSLVTIFLKKQGKRFDPLIDLPNEDKISEAIESIVKSASGQYEIGRLRVEGLADFAEKFGNDSGVTILRLVSQLLQDKAKEVGANVFVGFLNGDDFVIAGNRENKEKVLDGVKLEFNAVLPFIYQSEGYKPIEKGIEDIYGAEKPKLELTYNEISKEGLKERRAEVLKNKSGAGVKDIGSYTYDELRHMLGGGDLDITITRDIGGVRLSVGKTGSEDKDDEEK